MGGSDIFEYLDYRDYLKRLVEGLRQTNSYSARKFAAKVGFKSANYMKLILDGKRNLTPITIKKMIEAFEFNKTEGDFFKRLVEFNQSKTHEERDRNFQELVKFKRFQRVRKMEAVQYEYFSHWYTIALFVALGTSWNKKSIADMAASLQITTKEVQRGLEILEQLNLIERKNGCWKSRGIVLESPAEMNSLNIRNFHREMLTRGLNSLDQLPTHEREVGSLTLALSPNSFRDLRDRLIKFRQELSLLFSEEADPRGLYQLHLLLFPLMKIEGANDDVVDAV